jgi:hypothetical protein
MIKKIIKIVLIIVVLGLVISQFIRPERFSTTEVTKDDITNVLKVPDDVQKVLKRSCYDCHSNHTVWPWYTNVSPVNWLVYDDVNSGRHKMNFSEWGKLSVSKQSTKLQNISENVKDGDMPLPKYLLIHRDAVLSQQEKDILCKWADAQADSLGN